MGIFKGVGVSAGRVLGPVKQMLPAVVAPVAGQTRASSIPAEQAIAALHTAADAVQNALRQRAAQLSGDAKAVIEATALMAADPMLLKTAKKLIDNGLSAEVATWQAAEGIANTLQNLGGAMAERARDVFDVRDRLVSELRGEPAPGIPVSSEPFILIADDLAPADTATLDPSRVLALVTASGGPQSHTAIIARSLGLPAIVAAAGVTSIADGHQVYLDGGTGVLDTDPSHQHGELAAAWASKVANLTFDGEGRLADGRRIPLLANVGSAADALAARTAHAEGIGLFRTEFLFLERDTEPTVEEQVRAYRAVFSAFADPISRPKVVVRTLDAGADKPLPFLAHSAEPNPALGIRGYRMVSQYRAILTRQLQAIALAAQDIAVSVWVMAPMISTAAEAGEFTALCRAAGLATSGVMIEVPSAALSAAQILGEVDFASLGTNDLTQYTMAADRQLGALASLNDSWQPAVLALIQLSCQAAAIDSSELGVCGEAAADPALAVVLVGLGVSSLSMTAHALPAVAAALASIDSKEAVDLAALAVAAPDAITARRLVRERLAILTEIGI
ncbi:phosphoenolpyruvate--protein phosphotransferase [Psychromicrobium lacuslunae]|uniref:Phosphoenolpyruvate-protein phosphotransferase n=1 Tax=Psychromicrobium lacuslunae TaxID=1618207 RepID=A0A0D4C265_9MICC|nr:phosphoenolpyruvate--protein phosphotransferase [Psychromicrobium lacuslunae]AJT42466.1 phosphoenolpyruvate-protein phosphotransferase [Psychromicrobium lacuslunae]